MDGSCSDDSGIDEEWAGRGPDPTGGGPEQEERLAAAVCLHIAVALELVAGQRATFQPVQDCGTRCPGGTTPGSGPSGQLVVPPR
jgi:hypothetical protein